MVNSYGLVLSVSGFAYLNQLEGRSHPVLHMIFPSFVESSIYTLYRTTPIKGKHYIVHVNIHKVVVPITAVVKQSGLPH